MRRIQHVGLALAAMVIAACSSAQPATPTSAPSAPAAPPTLAATEVPALPQATVLPATEVPAAVAAVDAAMPADAVTAVKPVFIDFYAPW